jgi:hypothetical protein
VAGRAMANDRPYLTPSGADVAGRRPGCTRCQAEAQEALTVLALADSERSFSGAHF